MEGYRHGVSPEQLDSWQTRFGPYQTLSPTSSRRSEAQRFRDEVEFYRDRELSAEGKRPLDWSLVKKGTGETREQHVELHGTPPPWGGKTKANHGVFYGDPIATTNDAWRIAQRQGIIPIQRTNDKGERLPDVYVVPRPNSGYRSGLDGRGENLDHVSIITKPDSNVIISGYPGNATPPPEYK